MDIKIAGILAGITERSDEAYFIYNLDEKKLEHLSPAFEFITYLEKDAVLSQPSLLFQLVHRDDHDYLEKKIKAILNDKYPSLISFRIIREDGQQRWLKLNLYPVTTDDNVNYLTGIAEDDTIRRTSLLTMEKVSAWKNASLEILSHDLREPIATIRMLASIIAKKLPDNEQVNKLTSMIEEIAGNNIDLIQSILKREQLVANNVGIKKERLDMVWELKHAMAMYLEAQKSLQKNISFTYSQEKIYAEVDSLKFIQVVNNLISNAIKFTGVKGTISAHLKRLDTTFLLTVQDDGIGIPKKLHPYLFQKYSKAGRVGLDGQDSIGLGMWIVKNIVDEHQGKVWFESEEANGSTFYVELPIGEHI